VLIKKAAGKLSKGTSAGKKGLAGTWNDAYQGGSTKRGEGRICEN